MRRVFQYLKHTLDDKRIMVADSLRQLCIWVDAAYGVHSDLKSHTGRCTSFVYRMLHGNSIKQTLNTKVQPRPK